MTSAHAPVELSQVPLPSLTELETDVGNQPERHGATHFEVKGVLSCCVIHLTQPRLASTDSQGETADLGVNRLFRVGTYWVRTLRSSSQLTLNEQLEVGGVIFGPVPVPGSLVTVGKPSIFVPELVNIRSV